MIYISIIHLHHTLFQFYFGCSKETLEEMVKPHLREEYAKHQGDFLEGPLTRRQPLLFKEECKCFELTNISSSQHVSLHSVAGAGIVSLAPKMYIGFQEVTDIIRALVQDILGRTDNCRETVDSIVQAMKVSSKGLQKNNNLTVIDFLNVLKTQIPKEGVNTIMRAIHSNMYTMDETRRGPDYLYRKRIVLSNGINTVRLPEPDELPAELEGDQYEIEE